jgi:homogentisate 1,2-dioxygenase
MSRCERMSGFGNEHSSEAVPGAIPEGRFSPQKPPLGLYAEKFSATAFTAPRADNRRTWFYRILPSVTHGAYTSCGRGHWTTLPADFRPAPNQLRWDPLTIPDDAGDFVEGMFTLAGCGDLASQTGMAAHVYLARRSMERRFFHDADGELLILPQQGRLCLHTECGPLEVAPGEMALIPRGIKFRVELLDGQARGYVCENFGAAFRLPERGPVGSDGFANARDFSVPRAAFDTRQGDFELLVKFGGQMFSAHMDHSPLDVVGWLGTCYPVKYPLTRFNTMNTVSYDHPDPSIFTVLTAPSDTPGVANADFVIFPPRWMVADDTFRPPWFHRNVMSEFMGLIEGQYDARGRGFEPGGASLHPSMSAHGPEVGAHAAASAAALEPRKLEHGLAFMFESRYALAPTAQALALPALQTDYLACWRGFQREFSGA